MFTKDVKRCIKCKKGTVKSERESCKYCGCEEWENIKEAKEEESMKATSIKEAKMMNEMDGKDHESDMVVDGEATALVAIKQMVEDAKAGAVGEAGAGAVANSEGTLASPSEASSSSQAVVEGKQSPSVASPLRQWDFLAVRLGQPGPAQHKTLDDLLVSFLRWSQKDEDRAAGRINVSKAFRRLEAFAAWCVFFSPSSLTVCPRPLDA